MSVTPDVSRATPDHRFKRHGADARGSRDFGNLFEYAQFLKDLFAQRNAGRRIRLAEEVAVMRELPERRMESAKRERVKVTRAV